MDFANRDAHQVRFSGRQMQHRRRQRKIHRQRDRVDDRRDERRRHDGRVEADLRCDERQRTADELCKADNKNKGDAYDDRNSELQMVQNQELHEIGQ